MTSLQMVDVATFRGDYDAAERLLARAKTWAYPSGNPNSIHAAWVTDGHLAWVRGDQERAAVSLQKALSLACERAHSFHEAWDRGHLALVACDQGRYDDAEALCNQVLDLAAEQMHYVRCWAFSNLGRVALLRDESARAVELGRQVIDHMRHGESRPDAAVTCEYLAWAQAADGQVEESTRFLAVAARERDEMGVVLYPVDLPYHEQAMETVCSALGEQAFETAWAEGEALSLDEAVARALGR